jgi:hypothetical protein
MLYGVRMNFSCPEQRDPRSFGLAWRKSHSFGLGKSRRELGYGK